MTLLKGDRVRRNKDGKLGTCWMNEHETVTGHSAVYVSWDDSTRPSRPNMVSQLTKVEDGIFAVTEYPTSKPAKPSAAAKLGSIGLRYDARQKLLLAMDEAIAANDDPAMTAMMTEQRNRAARTFGQA